MSRDGADFPEVPQQPEARGKVRLVRPGIAARASPFPEIFRAPACSSLAGKSAARVRATAQRCSLNARPRQPQSNEEEVFE
jgi:hypothetical protein